VDQNDSHGVHKCDDTRGVDTKQLDDGIDHTFISAGREGDALSSLSLLGFVRFDLYYVLSGQFCRTDTKVQWTRTYGAAHPPLGDDP
jgi:hypothetical protein